MGPDPVTAEIERMRKGAERQREQERRLRARGLRSGTIEWTLAQVEDI
jgi:hypothetical protein